MKRSRILATAVLGLVMAAAPGCLSLSLFNRETTDAKARLDALEHRVSALETTHTQQPPVMTGPVGQFTPLPPQR